MGIERSIKIENEYIKQPQCFNFAAVVFFCFQKKDFMVLLVMEMCVFR